MRVLLVESNGNDALLVAKMLESAPSRLSPPIELLRINRLSSALDRLRAEDAAAVLVDVSADDTQDLDAFTSARAVVPGIPWILLANRATEDLANRAVKCGAQDYLVKDELTAALLHRCIEHAIERHRLQGELARRERVALELYQSEKLEAVGQVAGNMAHDLNNLLLVIQSFGGFAMEALPAGAQARNDIAEVLTASDRAAELIRQLLAFAQRQPIDPKIVNLNGLVLSMRRTLEEVLGHQIHLITRSHNGLWHVNVDPEQIKEALVRLAMNAREATPRGGKVTIETGNVVLDAEYAREHAGVTPGEYVLLALSDTGAGMPREVAARAFEPFFTTKSGEKHSGLGLAMCYGTVKQALGHICVCSEPGHGTTVKIYLPRIVQGVTHVACSGIAPGPAGGETVLIVDDEPAVLATLVRTLKRVGYEVLQASSGAEALELCEHYKGRIDLLITDVVMPAMNGRELADHVAPVRPEMKVLYISGFTANAIVHQGVLDAGTAFLAKPFSSEALARRVREILDVAPRQPPPHVDRLID